MWLILSAAADTAAYWAYQGLAALGLSPLHWVQQESLIYSRHWEHRIGSSGAHVKIELSDGRVIDSACVRGAINRLMFVPHDAVSCAVPNDREYALQELFAFYMSWLRALPVPILNRATSQGLSGRWRHPSEWVALASAARLPLKRYRQSARDPVPMGHPLEPRTGHEATNVIVIGQEVFGGPLPEEAAEGCRRLAALSDTEILGVELENDGNGRLRFASATPSPDLRLGGPPLLRHLANVLRNGGQKQ